MREHQVPNPTPAEEENFSEEIAVLETYYGKHATSLLFPPSEQHRFDQLVTSANLLVNTTSGVILLPPIHPNQTQIATFDRQIMIQVPPEEFAKTLKVLADSGKVTVLEPKGDDDERQSNLTYGNENPERLSSSTGDVVWNDPYDGDDLAIGRLGRDQVRVRESVRRNGTGYSLASSWPKTGESPIGVSVLQPEPSGIPESQEITRFSSRLESRYVASESGINPDTFTLAGIQEDETIEHFCARAVDLAGFSNFIEPDLQTDYPYEPNPKRGTFHQELFTRDLSPILISSGLIILENLIELKGKKPKRTFLVLKRLYGGKRAPEKWSGKLLRVTETIGSEIDAFLETPVGSYEPSREKPWQAERSRKPEPKNGTRLSKQKIRQFFGGGPIPQEFKDRMSQKS